MTKAIIRYHSATIVLHWAMAVGFLFMLGSGLYMVNGDLSRADQFQLYQTHKAAGVVMLVALVVRICIRFLTRQPALPQSIPQQERRLAKLGHSALYVMLLAIPVTGWIMVSASPFGLPTFVFVDWLKWPHIPGLAKNEVVEDIARAAHWYIVVTMIFMLIAHIGAVVMHKYKHNVSLLKRMWWSK